MEDLEKATHDEFEALAAALRPFSLAQRLRLLHFLVRPHYLEEIGEHLGMSRQAAEKHVDQLLEVGLVRKQLGQRASGPVTEYVLVPQRVFAVSEEFARLGELRPEVDAGPERTATAVAIGGVTPGLPRGPTLVVVHGMRIGHAFALAGAGPWTLGREADCHVSLDYDPFASTRHAEVQVRDGKHVLVDTFARNGTFHNWRRLERGGSVVLAPGDVVGVGKSLLVYRA